MATDIPPDTGIMAVMELLIKELVAADPHLHDRLIGRVEDLIRDRAHQEHQETLRLTLRWLKAMQEGSLSPRKLRSDDAGYPIHRNASRKPRD